MQIRAAVAVLFAIPALAGCLNDTSEPPAEWEAAPAEWEAMLHDVSQPTVDVSSLEFEQHRIVLRDEIELDAWLMVPPAEASDNEDGTFPLIVHLTPYWGGGPPSDCIPIPGVTDDRGCSVQYYPFVERGYAYALVSMRGTGNSEGCFTTGGPDEAQDSAQAIEYFAGMEWSNGNVGAAGLSYDGTTVNDVWEYAPPSLKAVMPVSGISQMYEYSYLNGVHRGQQGYTPFQTYYWAIVGLGPAGIEGGTQVNDPPNIPATIVGEACEDQIEVHSAGAQAVLEPEMTPYWIARDFNEEFRTDPGKQRAPMLLVQGLQDWNVATYHMDPWVETVRASGAPLHMMLGQWGHEWPWSDSWREYVTAFFDQYLKERDTGIKDVPKVFVQDTAGQWRAESAWPPIGAPTADFRLGDGGKLLPIDAEPASGSVSFLDLAGGNVARIGVPQESVRWESEAFDEDTHLSGIVRVGANVTASGPRANIVWSLGVDGVDGERVFTWAPQSLNLWNDETSFDQDVTGKTMAMEVGFAPADIVVPAGGRIVLYASGIPVVTHNSDSWAPLSTIHSVEIDLASGWLSAPLDTSITVLPDVDFCNDLCSYTIAPP